MNREASRDREYLKQALLAAKATARRAEASQAGLQSRMPVDAADVEAADSTFELEVDAMIKRVEQLQDILERQVVRSLLACEGEAVRELSVRDRINRLETLTAVPLAERWQALRELRNELAHDYPLQFERQANRINGAFRAIGTLVEILGALMAYAARRGLADDEAFDKTERIAP